MGEVVESQGADLLSECRFLSLSSVLAHLWVMRHGLPSPTTSWYSGPVGCDRILFVSIMGAACPFATARL